MNLEQTLARFVNNEGMLRRFLKKFLDDQSYDKLKEAMARSDSEDAFHQAHTLKGVAGNLGLGDLFEAVGAVVELLRAGEMEKAEALFPPVEAAYENARQVIQSMD